MKEGYFFWHEFFVDEDAPRVLLTRSWLKRNAHTYDAAGHMLLHECLSSRRQHMIGGLMDIGGIDIYAKTKPRRETVLHLSAQYNLPACLELFLRLGRDHFNLNCRDVNGLTPLHLAAHTWIQTGDTRCLDILLEWGANINTRDGINDKTVLDMLLTTPIRDFPLWRAEGMVLAGARVSGDRYGNWPNLIAMAELQQSLARSRLASRATCMALRHLPGKVHKDVIPLIAAAVEATRKNIKWKRVYFCWKQPIVHLAFQVGLRWLPVVIATNIGYLTLS